MRTDPLLLERDDAQRLLLSELADPGYRQAQPSVLSRLYDWLLEQLQKLLDSMGSAAGDGRIWVLIVVLAALIAVGFIARRRLGARGRPTQSDALLGPGTLSADEHRGLADELMASGDAAGAIRERLRAIVRTCEESGIVEPQPSWTADEISRAVASAFPPGRDAVSAATRIFDDVWYGGITATAERYARMSELDEAVSGLERAR